MASDSEGMSATGICQRIKDDNHMAGIQMAKRDSPSADGKENRCLMGSGGACFYVADVFISAGYFQGS
jgi:hypothetical protein